MAWLVKDKIKENYLACCKEAVLSDTAFNRFKKDKRYTPITEHLDRDIGQAYLDKIIEKNEYIFNVKKKRFLRNDLYGQPKRYDYGKYGIWSPTTLRYIYVAFELKKYFNGLDCMDIVEIGGGYGGQCKIINDMRGFKSYKIIDLKEPC
ncbi:MAG: putative sugar O-methyltransferase, partial [Gammaproteobacteria bacterium]|nr:putative sugar O-methyltransferase [Gammaproteobacteria bacterium]